MFVSTFNFRGLKTKIIETLRSNLTHDTNFIRSDNESHSLERNSSHRLCCHSLWFTQWKDAKSFSVNFTVFIRSFCVAIYYNILAFMQVPWGSVNMGENYLAKIIRRKSPWFRFAKTDHNLRDINILYFIQRLSFHNWVVTHNIRVFFFSFLLFSFRWSQSLPRLHVLFHLTILLWKTKFLNDIILFSYINIVENSLWYKDLIGHWLHQIWWLLKEPF